MCGFQARSPDGPPRYCGECWFVMSSNDPTTQREKRRLCQDARKQHKKYHRNDAVNEHNGKHRCPNCSRWNDSWSLECGNEECQRRLRWQCPCSATVPLDLTECWLCKQAMGNGSPPLPVAHPALGPLLNVAPSSHVLSNVLRPLSQLWPTYLVDVFGRPIGFHHPSTGGFTPTNTLGAPTSIGTMVPSFTHGQGAAVLQALAHASTPPVSRKRRRAADTKDEVVEETEVGEKESSEEVENAEDPEKEEIAGNAEDDAEEEEAEEPDQEQAHVDDSRTEASGESAEEKKIYCSCQRPSYGDMMGCDNDEVRNPRYESWQRARCCIETIFSCCLLSCVLPTSSVSLQMVSLRVRRSEEAT